MNSNHLAVLFACASIACWTACGEQNNRPIADAGPDQTSGVLAGDLVILDGSGSTDRDGDDLTYAWSLETIPEDSEAELSDPASANSNFIADIAGEYMVHLAVSDGRRTSRLDAVEVAVTRPPPVVSIDAPEPQSLASENPVTISGSVSDPLAAITVDGEFTVNDAGSFTADVDLAEGSNTVTVMAVNETGHDSASIEITLITTSGPMVTITSPAEAFTAGLTWDGCGAAPEFIPIQVEGIITTFGATPDAVEVNGEQATLETTAPRLIVSSFCRAFPNSILCTIFDTNRARFSATIELEKGARTITVVGTDSAGGTARAAIGGVADYCHVAEEGTVFCDATSIPSENAEIQNNVCHAIDGCSSGRDPAPNARRNEPMPGAEHNVAPIRFGYGSKPPEEFFVHGLAPNDPVGCNVHDTCYQTCVEPGGGARLAAWTTCNGNQFETHKAVCRRAYPTSVCPYGIGELFKCPAWRQERTNCFLLAGAYFSGVKTPFGLEAYLARQDAYCSSP
jgi:hypothetical protein